MSKKSRKRNKKILAALALAGGAAMLGRGKNLGVSGADKAKFTSDAAYTGGGYDDAIMRRQKLSPYKPPYPNFDMFDDPNFAAAKGGRAMKSKGGSVTGIAKRGFGRALMKGRK
jgi:hypothetical protein